MSETGSPSFLPPFIPLRPLARWAAGLLVATCVAGWVAVGVDLHELRLLSRATGGESIAPIAREAWTLTDTWLFWTRALLFVATAGAFLSWLYQARVNLRAMGVRRPRYGRDWAITGFLVPVLNLFRPYQVVREVWQASDASNLDPFSWRDLPVPPLLMIWWTLMVAWAALGTVALLTGMGAGVTLPKLQLAAFLHVLADALAAVAAFAGCFVVWRISDAQERKRALLAGATPQAQATEGEVALA